MMTRSTCTLKRNRRRSCGPLRQVNNRRRLILKTPCSISFTCKGEMKMEVSSFIQTEKGKVCLAAHLKSWNQSLIKKTHRSRPATVRWVKSVMTNGETAEDFRSHSKPVRQRTGRTPAAFATRTSGLNPSWLATWRRTRERNLTAAAFVERASSSAPICRLTWTLTPDRSRTHVAFVAEGSRRLETWTRTFESIQERNLTAVATVAKALERKQISSSTQSFTLARSPTSALYVVWNSVLSLIWRATWRLIQGRGRTAALLAGKDSSGAPI